MPKAITELKEANLAYLGVKVTITNRGIRYGDLHDMLSRLLQNTVKIIATDSFNGFLPEIFNGYTKLMEVNPCIPKAVNIGCRLDVERGKYFEW